MADSTVPAALAALLSVIDAAFTAAADDVDVHDGPPVVGERPDGVAVGFSTSGEDYTAVTDWTLEPAGMAPTHPEEERYAVLCALWSSSGNISMAERRVRALAMFKIVRDAIRADPTLGGVVRIAAARVASLLQESDPEAATTAVSLDFRVDVQARI